MVLFGQVVVGPPGSGKSTYCNGMQQMFKAIGRNHFTVNLDPANDCLPYDCDIDIKELISVEQVMEEHKLGPNGALIYAMEYLKANFDWLASALQRQPADAYAIIDCPGQIELFTHHSALTDILRRLEKTRDARLAAIHLVDSTFCSDPLKYISALLVALSTQVQLELPHVNVLSKLDLLKTVAADLDFRIEFYANVEGLTHLLRLLAASTDNPRDLKFRNFNEALCELIEDYNPVSFQLLDIEDKESVLKLLSIIDNANGFRIGGVSVLSSSADWMIRRHEGSNMSINNDWYGSIQEKYIPDDSD